MSSVFLLKNFNEFIKIRHENPLISNLKYDKHIKTNNESTLQKCVIVQ